MHGLSLIYVLRAIPGVEQFRVTQKAVDDFDVELVASHEFSRSSEAVIRNEFSQRLRAPVNVGIQYFSALPPSKNGKFRYLISEVDAQQALM